MLKGLSRLWLRAVKSAGKVQKKQNKKLVKMLFAKPAKAKRSTTRSNPLKPVTKKVRAPAATTKPKIDVRTTPAPGKWLRFYYSSLTFKKGRRMEYWLYVPDNIKTTSIPLMVMLHGCDQTATQFAQGTRMNQLAEKKGFAVLYPQQSLSGHPARCWHWYDKATQDGGGEAQMIAGVIETVLQKYSIDKTRIYIAGISAGAAMANIVALNFPHLIAAVGLHSGAVFGAGHSPMEAYAVMQHGAAKVIGSAMHKAINTFQKPKMPAILFHGEMDMVVRPINLVQLTQQFRVLNQLSVDTEVPAILKAAGANGSGRSNAYKTYDYILEKKLLLRVCEVHQLEHAWSGGDCTLKFNACPGPDASKMMWDFFAKHQRLETNFV